MNTPPKILIEVRGGVADVIMATGNVGIILVDWDNEQAGDKITLEPLAPPIVSETAFKKELQDIKKQIA